MFSPAFLLSLFVLMLGACTTIRCDDQPMGSRVCPCYSCESIRHDWSVHD